MSSSSSSSSSKLFVIFGLLPKLELLFVVLLDAKGLYAVLLIYKEEKGEGSDK